MPASFLEGSEDVAFKKTLDGSIIEKAHALVLANQSKELHDKIYPIQAGYTFPIIVSAWTQATKSEAALNAFVKILYVTSQTFASLNFNVVFGVFSLAAVYQIPGSCQHRNPVLTTALLESKTNSVMQNQIPLQDLLDYLTLAHKNHFTLELLLTVMVEK